MLQGRASSTGRPCAIEALPDAIMIGDIHIRVVDQPHWRDKLCGAALREQREIRRIWRTDFNGMK